VSEVKRYSIVADYQAPWAKMHEFSAGGWVKWEDYARLQADVRNCYTAIRVKDEENARLKADVNELADGLKLASEVGIKIADEVTRLKAENARLKAEVERLREAGDDMAFHIGNDEESQLMCADRWRAAKEGKQS